MFIDWEKIHGRIFNGENHKVIPKQDDKLICPYSDLTDILFGRDFNEYTECDDCKIRLDCEQLHSKYVFTKS
jgi:hypothetical protein